MVATTENSLYSNPNFQKQPLNLVININQCIYQQDSIIIFKALMDPKHPKIPYKAIYLPQSCKCISTSGILKRLVSEQNIILSNIQNPCVNSAMKSNNKLFIDDVVKMLTEMVKKVSVKQDQIQSIVDQIKQIQCQKSSCKNKRQQAIDFTNVYFITKKQLSDKRKMLHTRMRTFDESADITSLDTEKMILSKPIDQRTSPNQVRVSKEPKRLIHIKQGNVRGQRRSISFEQKSQRRSISLKDSFLLQFSPNQSQILSKAEDLNLRYTQEISESLLLQSELRK